MIHEYDEILKRLKERRKLYLEALEEALGALESERAALASQSRPRASRPRAKPRRRPKRGSGTTKGDRVCAAAEEFLRREGAPRGLVAIYAAVEAAGVDVGKGTVSAVLSRAPDFFSEAKKWHLAAWREETNDGAGEASRGASGARSSAE